MGISQSRMSTSIISGIFSCGRNPGEVVKCDGEEFRDVAFSGETDDCGRFGSKIVQAHILALGRVDTHDM